MADARGIARLAGIGAGVVAAASGAAYGAQRLAASRVRGRPDGDADAELVPRADDVRVLDSHDGFSPAANKRFAASTPPFPSAWMT